MTATDTNKNRLPRATGKQKDSFLQTETKVKTRFPKESGRNTRINIVENRLNEKTRSLAE